MEYRIHHLQEEAFKSFQEAEECCEKHSQYKGIDDFMAAKKLELSDLYLKVGIIYHEMMVAEINKKEDKERYQILIEQNLYEKNEAEACIKAHKI